MLRLKMIFCLIQAFLIIVSSFSVYDSKFKLWVDRAAMKTTSDTNFEFDRVDSALLEISDKEKSSCREWFNANILTDKNPAYDFVYGKKNLRDNLNDWDITIGAESETGKVRRGGKTSIIELASKSSGLAAQIEATIYEEYATCEWTVFIRNNGDGNSPAVKDFYSADITLEAGSPYVYFSKGTDPAADDFELMKSAVCPTDMVFNSNGGRIRSYLPYFNVSGNDGGFVASVGWTGQWYSSLKNTFSGVKFKAKQEFLNAYLEPGEEIRSPLVSLTFYSGNNALKGFNSFRRWEKDCVYPESIRCLNGYVIANEFNTKTCDELIEEVNSIDESVLESTDYFWMDAGWYEYNEGWYDGVGNWIPNKNRFPDGIKPLSDAVGAKGKRMLLWYEPERVREGTYLYNEGIKHNGWTVTDGENIMWNLADSDACDFLSEYISSSLISNGITMYRQDFNFDPLSYWRKADKEYYSGREGICENHYVTNLYRYLDYLLNAVDGLIIDNCASGGKRLDAEMTRRSLPLWRSDYNCGDEFGNLKPDLLEATQSMTAGLSFWFVYTGTNRHFHSQYASRSAILTDQSVYQPTAEYAAYSDISKYMTRNYYPLTLGGVSDKNILAMQFGDKSEGAAIIYIRENTNKDDYVLRLNGLQSGAEYEINDIDNPAFSQTVTGGKLMSDGIALKITERPKAIIIKYSIENN